MLETSLGAALEAAVGGLFDVLIQYLLYSSSGCACPSQTFMDLYGEI